MTPTLPLKAVRRDDRDDVQRDDDGVGAHSLQGAPTVPWRTPLTSALLEREDECAAIAAALAGPGGCVLVSGPPGIGKSALLDEARRFAAVPVLSARGSELEQSFAFGGVQQLFARVTVPEEGAAAHAAAAFSVGGEPDHAVLHGLYWLTAGLGPLALVVDDAHWLDRQSLRWLAYMVNRVADLPLALILAARDDEPQELLTRIAVHPATRVLTPKPLSREAVAQLAGEARAPAIHEATGGNPFYVHALLAEEREGTPRSVIESIALRLERLPPACTALARAIAVVGAGGTIAARLAGLDVRAVVEAAEALTAADLLRGDGFAHPLVQQAVYAMIGAGERAELHAAAAHLVTGPERVAAHVMAAGPGGGVWAAQALRAAAAAAWARGAPEVAVTFLRRAADEELPRSELVPLLRELARALIATEGPGGFPVLRQALALGGDERGEIALELGRALFTQGYFGEACAAFEAGLAASGAGEHGDAAGGRSDAAAGDAAGERDDAAGGRSDAAAGDAAGGRDDAAGGGRASGRRDAAPRLGVAERLEAELATVAVLDLGLVRRFGGLDALAARLPAGASAVGAWIEVARRPPAAVGAERAEAALADAEPSSLAGALVALMAAGRLARADAIWTQIAGTARAAGALETLRMAVALRAIVRLRQGRIAEAEADLRELIAWVGELELPYGELRMALPWVVSPLVDALVERGELEEAQHWIAVTALERDWPEVFGFTFLLDSLARLRLAQGRAPEALNLARETGRRQRGWGIRNPGFLAWGSTLAAAAAATGRTEEALDACDEQADLAKAFSVAREHGMALLALGRITGDADTMREAVRVLEDSPARLEHARALAALNDRESLRKALELAERCGATALATHARNALVATGAKPRRTALTGTAALTAAQERVARLAAGGLGNRDIAELLFVTEKTVEGHLGAAYRKLGIASRAQLGEALRTDPRDGT